MKLYRFSNDILVHSISTGCPTLTQSRWAPSCHTWRGTNLTWQKWVGISILLIKTGRAGKTFLQGQSIKEKAWGLFHSCFAHWPESSGAAGNGVIGSAKVLPAEGHFMAFRVFKKYNSRTPHAHCFFCLSFHKQIEIQQLYLIIYFKIKFLKSKISNNGKHDFKLTCYLTLRGMKYIECVNTEAVQPSSANSQAAQGAEGTSVEAQLHVTFTSFTRILKNISTSFHRN